MDRNIGSALSGFAVLYESLNPTGDSLGGFNKMMERLSHRGPDGCDVVFADNVSMGHWHFWTTPEEVGERQPLRLNELPFRIVFDGRLDNRNELFEKLHIPSVEGEALSDAALALYAYAQWGACCFEQFIGEFALVIFDEQHNEVVCARDQLGDRTLFYMFQGTQFVVASEPWAVAGINPTKPNLSDRAIAHYFTVEATEDGQTLFENIYELLPAHILKVTPSGRHIWQYWQPDLGKRIRYQTDEEYAAHFLALLEESVRCRMRSAMPVAVLMSGGLDSTSVAALAARMIQPQPLTTISFVFDQLSSEIDEKKYINAFKEYWNLHSIQIPCDDYYPYKNLQNHSQDPNQPEADLYWLMQNQAYSRMRSDGFHVLLTGIFGDHLYNASNRWLLDLIIDKHFRQAIQSVSHCISLAGWRKNWNAGYLQKVVMHFINLLFGITHLGRSKDVPDWLSTYSSDAILQQKPSEGQRGMTGKWTAQLSTREMFSAGRASIELRHPFRDRRLIEFVLALPAYQLFHCGLSKYILRTAMKGKMPDLVRLRKKDTSMIPLFNRGLEREKTTIQEWIFAPNAQWRKFVQPNWVLKHWDIMLTPQQDNAHALVTWLCVAYESWHRSYRANGTGTS